jgi:hypothetical protein
MQASQPVADPVASTESATFHIQLRSGIWGVKLDGRFYGDYRAMNLAMESVGEKACALRTAGRSVHIVTLSANGAVLASTLLGPAQSPSGPVLV